MAKADIKLTRNGPRELRKSPEVLADMRARASRIAAQAGSGMEVDARQGKNRARASVITATFEARRREASSRALTSSIDAGR